MGALQREELIMGENTKIEWCDHTINNFWGCHNTCSFCTARSIARRFGRRIGTARGYSKEVIEKMANFEPVFLADQLQKLYTIKKPGRIFMSFMGEPFSPEFKQDMPYIWQSIKDNPRHTVLMLTKQPQNLLQYSPFPSNCWVGYSATNPDMFIKGLRYISEIDAKVKFVSLEPLLEWNNFIGYNAWELLNWCIIGARTPYSEKTFPKWDWIEKIIVDCDKCGTPVFLKDNLRLPQYSCDGRHPFYELHRSGTLVLRQELPNIKG
jgi:protein gp37